MRLEVDRPVFIISSERSGSNLLRTLLSNHSRLAAPVAAQLLPTFHTLAPYYGPLEERKNALRLISDMASVVNHPYYGWNLEVDGAELYGRYRPVAFLDFFTMFYVEKQQTSGKQRFVCKENDLFDFAFALRHYYKDAHFIYLYRDPRDVVASQVKAPFGPNTPYGAAQLWKREQVRCDVLLHTFQLPAHALSYESLIDNPARTMEGVLQFLEEPVEPACFRVETEKNETVDWNVAWKNLSRPIMKHNAGKYRALFARKTLDMIESITAYEMERLGYARDTEATWNRPPLFGLRNTVMNWFRRRFRRGQHRETTAVLDSRNQLIRSIREERITQWRSRRQAWGVNPEIAGRLQELGYMDDV